MAEPDPYADPYTPDRIVTRGLTDEEIRASRMRTVGRSFDPNFIAGQTPLPQAPWMGGPGSKTLFDPTGWGRQPDALDATTAAIGATARPLGPWLSLPDPIATDWAKAPVHEGRLWDAFTHGVGDTLIGTVLRRQQAISQVDMEMGWNDGMPQPGYDAYKDPQLKDWHHEMWRFHDSVSPQETRLRLLQLVQSGERDRAMARNQVPGAGFARMVGNIADPSIFLPATAGVASALQIARGLRFGAIPALSWGIAANAVEGAVVNASLALSTQAANASLDVSQTLEGMSDLLLISGGLGALAGALSGIAARSHVRETVRKGLDAPAASYKVGETVVDYQGTRWVVGEEKGEKYFEPAPPSALDGAPTHPLDTGDVSLGKSLSSAVVPGMATSINKALIEAEGLAPAGGLEKLPVSPGFRNLASSSFHARQTTLRLIDTGGLKQNKNLAERMGLRETPADVLAERAQLEKQIAANEAALASHKQQLTAASLQPWSDGIYRLSPAKGATIDATGRPVTPDSYDLRGRISDRVADNYPIGAKVMDEYGVIWTVETGGRGHNSFGRAEPNFAFEPRTAPGKPGLLETDAEYAIREAAEQARLATPPATPPTDYVTAKNRIGVTQRLLEADRTALADPDLALAVGRQEAEKSSNPVSSKFSVLWKSLMNSTEQSYRAAWLEVRAAIAGKVLQPGEAESVGRSFLQQGADLFGGDAALKFGPFRERVTKAIRNGGVDPVQDALSPGVEKAAAAGHAFFDEIAKAADHPDVNLFRKEAEAALAKIEERRQAYLEKQKLAGELPHPAVIGQFDDLAAKLEKTVQNGPHQSNSKWYVPAVYRMDKMAADGGRFVRTVADWIVSSSTRAGNAIDSDVAYKAAQAAYDKITHTKAQSIDQLADEVFDEISNPGAVKARTLDIPHELIEDFLENDIIMLTRYHGTQMGSAIEMTREFGDINMTRQLKDIADEYKGLIERESDVRRRAELLRERDQALEDTRTLRDRVLGVEGAAKDPHSWSERTIRMLKHYTAWTTMGLSALSQMADFPRIVLTEGMDAAFRYGLGSLVDNSRAEIFKWVAKERLHAGDVMELSTASGSMAFANIGDTFHSRTAVERAANNLSGHYFLANGLTWVTDLTRTMAAVSILGNMNAGIMAWGEALAKGVAFTDEKLMAKFRMLSMDGNDVLRMYNELKAHKVEFNSLTMPDTGAWTDRGAQELYRSAMIRQMDRTVVTPGAFERPTFMSTSVGSLIAQFKTFGVSSYSRTLVAGLQDNDRQFWLGAATLVGAGMVLNEIRNQLFYGKSSLDQPWLGVLADGIDRSGVLGTVMDANNAIEAVTHNKIGMRPLVGAPRRGPVSPEKMVGTFLGPSAEKATLGARLLGEYMSGNATARTWRESRGLIPGQNLPYTDWWFDMMFPKGKKYVIPKDPRLEAAR